MVNSRTVLHHAQTIYDLMEKDASPEEFEGNDLLVFRGSLTKVWATTEISRAYYSRVMRFLESSQCTTMLKRGAKNSLTAIALYRRPSEDDAETFSQTPLTNRGRAATIRLEGLEKRVATLEQQLGGMDIVEAFKEIERRLAKGGRK